MNDSDEMTGCATREAYLDRVETLKRQNSKGALGICVCDLNGLQQINDVGGKMEGDETICDLAKGLISVFTPQNVYRMDGDEFAAVLPDVAEEEFEKQIQRVREDAFPKWGVSISLGSAWKDHCDSPEELMALADQRMGEEKKQYYLENGTC